jgi:hypothetical protein
MWSSVVSRYRELQEALLFSLEAAQPRQENTPGELLSGKYAKLGRFSTHPTFGTSDLVL